MNKKTVYQNEVIKKVHDANESYTTDRCASDKISSILVHITTTKNSHTAFTHH